MRSRSALKSLSTLLALGALAVSVAAFAPARADAADNGRWSVFPTTVASQRPRTYFQPLLTPGVRVNDSVTITNKTDAPLVLDLYPADAYNTPEGGFASRRRDERQRDMGAWITLSRTNITVAAHGHADVDFTIDPPEDASPGDHTGSIVALDTVGTVNERGAINVRALQAVGARVYGRVAGPLTPRLEVTALSIRASGGVGRLLGGPVDAEVTYKVVNTGNVRLTPQARLRVSPLIGRGVNAEPLMLPEVLPRGSALVHQRVSGVVPVGRLKAELDLASAAPEVRSESTTWVIPWILVIVVIILLAMLWRRSRRRRRERAEDDAWSEVDEILDEAHS